MEPTEQIQLLDLIEIDNPEAAAQQEAEAQTKLRAVTGTREELEAKEAVCLEAEAKDTRAASYLHTRIAELAPTAHTARADGEHEIITNLQDCDAHALAQYVCGVENTLNLYSSAYSDLVERQQGLHRLETMEIRVSLQRVKARELEAMTLLSHIRTVITLAPAFKEQGRIGFVGQRTQELLLAAKEAHRLADVAENNLREMRAAYGKVQDAMANRGMLSKMQVGCAIPKY
jgi:hypothetical protein